MMDRKKLPALIFKCSNRRSDAESKSSQPCLRAETPAQLVERFRIKLKIPMLELRDSELDEALRYVHSHPVVND
jgi:hypothetical protein